MRGAARKEMGRCWATIWWPCLWFIAFILATKNRQATSLFLNDDVLGLIVFKADIYDPTSALTSWNENDDSPCNWTGVTCEPINGRVIEVSLDDLSLSGKIGRGLAKLEFLRVLSLARNNFSGSIDVDIAELKQLKTLNLASNALSGRIPYAFGLNVSLNLLSGPIPDEGGLYFGLRTLDISNNIFSGSISPAFASFRKLVDLRMQNNRLSGVIPEELGSCTNLATLDLSGNSLSGGIPVALQNLQSLLVLNLQDNFFMGPIPLWIGSHATLEILNLSRNLLTGPLLLPISGHRALRVLDVSNNRLAGQIPGNFSDFIHLSSFDISGNKFSGDIPEELLTLDLQYLRLSMNQLTGTISTAFSNNCTSIEALDLSQNQLRGAMPARISSCVHLEYVNMSFNFLSGNIPSGLDQLPSIRVFDLSHNQLSGSLPADIGNAFNLSVLWLARNSLSGQIPLELGRCSSLTDLRLCHNHLIGGIPSELGKLRDLQYLDLSFNNLSGAIPLELGELRNLAMVNVSYNWLAGPVPSGGIFNRLNATSFLGNADLCGADVNVTCPNVLPKPIVLNPNSTDSIPSGVNSFVKSTTGHIVLSPSAIIAISAAAAIALGVVIVTLLNIRAQTRSEVDPHMLDSFSHSLSTDLPIGKLVMFTNNSDPRSEEWVTSAHALLNKESELGRGGFGTVYKAVLADGRTVAIKKLMVSCLVKSQEDFEKEVQLLGNIRHQNLVGLQGYYWTSQLQLLIYDFIPKGNLYSRLHEKSQENIPLCWENRFKIALGTARGLAHLHHACHPQVIHYNMKSSNVLLDESYIPKIADYGLAKLLPILDRYILSSKFQSALGYMAPEFACQSLRINEKCDVYGFGVILLELVTGRRPVEYMEDDVVILCDYVRSLMDEGTVMGYVDSTLLDYSEDEVLPVIKLGLICTSQVPSNRPSMAEVVQILELIKVPTNSRNLP
eukprot:c24271_g1_i9 orf=748-3603(-)